MNKLRYLVWLALAVLLVVAPVTLAAPAPAPSPAGLAPIDPYILTRIEEEGQATFFVVLKLQADLSGAQAMPTKEAKGQYVFNALAEVASKTQGPITAALKAEKATYKSMWIRNMIKVSGDKALLTELAARPDVAEIIYEYPATLDVEPVTEQPAGTEVIEWNITRVGAPDVWAMGITGADVVVADLDTGVQWNHPALVNSYRGGANDHDYNWYDGGVITVPVDYGTHGTHTMGTIVGDDGGSNQIGMAPGAEWIACPGIGSPYVGPFECFQFFLAPTDVWGNNPDPTLAPHVISNSWSSAGTDYHAAIQALYQAGIFYSKSAGNEGEHGCGTITNPGQWPEVTAAAAFANGDAIAYYSSRGPVAIGYDKFVKPDIAAPGSGVRSSEPGGIYGSMSGTSMACPHVTGAVALLISANPELAGQIDVLQMLLKQTAEPKISAQCEPYVDHPNDVWGWGILDVQAAVVAAQAVTMGGIQGTVTDALAETLAPIPDAGLTFADATTGWPLHDVSAADGTYARPIPAGTYDVTANHYGYLPDETLGIVVTAGSTTTLNITMDLAPIWTVDGLVDETGTGTPLEAHILFANTPITADTNPATGLYAADVAQGTWWMDVYSPGHTREVRQVTVDQDLTENFTLPAIENYYMRTGAECGPAFNWLDASGGTVRNLSDDSNVFVVLPDSRSFTFYGQTYTGLYVVSNGLVVFGTSDSKWSGPIPDPAVPNNGIYAFSTDLNPASGSQGTIYTDYQQGRYFIIEWLNVQHYPSGDPETFEIVLDLDTGKVTIQYLTISNVADAVSGVENSTGTEATQYAYADPVLIDDGQVVDFYPAFGTPPPVGGLGTLSGTVTDVDTGAPIANATVTALSFTTGETATFTTGSEGTYAGPLCADWYELTFTAAGYRPATLGQVIVRSGQDTVVDEPLQHTQADLWLTKSGPAHAQPGDVLTYTLTFGSLGPDTTPAAGIVDSLSPDVTWVSGGTYDSVNHEVTWDVTDVLSGSVNSATLVVQITDTFTGTEVCNAALIAPLGLEAPVDPDGSNDGDAFCTPMMTPFRVYLPLVARSYVP